MGLVNYWIIACGRCTGLGSGEPLVMFLLTDQFITYFKIPYLIYTVNNAYLIYCLKAHHSLLVLKDCR